VLQITKSMNKNLVIQLPDLTPEIQLQTMSEVYDWGLLDLNIPLAHKQTMGEDITIGIVDTGKSEHFETVHATLDWKNFTNSPVAEDRNVHGTFIAGIIAAAKNDEGVIGIAPKCKLVFAKAMNDSGTGSPSSIVKAILWLVEKQVDIISISAGMFFDFKPLHKAVKFAFKKNIIVIAAVGNSGGKYYDVAFPARYPEVIGVAAYNRKHQIAKFSSRGINVSFAMPGVDIYSTTLHNQYGRMNGTSFSAPIMSGICALILSKHKKTNNPNTPCKTPSEMMEHLKKYAIKLGDKRVAGFGTLDIEDLFSKGN